MIVDLLIPNFQEPCHISEAKLMDSFYIKYTHTTPVGKINEMTFWTSRIWVHIYEMLRILCQPQSE